MTVNRSLLNMFLGKKVRLIKRDGSIEVGTLKPFKTDCRIERGGVDEKEIHE